MNLKKIKKRLRKRRKKEEEEDEKTNFVIYFNQTTHYTCSVARDRTQAQCGGRQAMDIEASTPLIYRGRQLIWLA